MVHKFSVHPLPATGVSRDYYIETAAPLTADQTATLARALADPLINAVTPNVPLPTGAAMVAYKRGIVDNECDSIVRLCAIHGVTAIAGKVAAVYAPGVVYDCNPNIEEVHTTEPHFDTLLPQGHYTPAESFDLTALDDDALAALGVAGGRNLSLRQMRQIRRIQTDTGARHVTDALLEAMDARWSDHCAHTTWKSLGHLLKKLIRSAEACNNPNVVSMFEDNAGIWEFYNGQSIALKAETHNGPSAISAYFGQLTKLGGVLRDVLGAGLGADPVGVFEYTATGIPGEPSPIAGRPDPRHIAHETIRAIKEYGNTFGTPMAWSHMTFHRAYRAKPFALGGCVGVIPTTLAAKGKPRPGDHVVLIGGLTGNDGIHGASASSAGSEMDTASVQIGSPLEEIKFRAAIIDLRDAGCIRAITDLGAAGLNSACGEMGEGVGIRIDTSKVPLKTAGLAMWRILLSESQERMLLAIPPGKLAEATLIFERHEVRAAVIGEFTGRGRYEVVHGGETGIDAPYELLDDAVEPVTPDPPPAAAARPTKWPKLSRDELTALLPRLLADPEIADQTYAGFQYDSSVQGRVFYGPHAGVAHRIATSYWAAQPIDDHPGAVILTAAFNPWLFDANPRLAARQMTLAALQAQVLAGAAVRDVCLCDNFYTPYLEPGSLWWLREMVEELAGLAPMFGTPFISGKDSSAGSVRTPEGVISVPPAVFITAVGKAPDAAKLVRNEWTAEGSALVRIGPDTPSAAGTVAARVLGVDANDIDAVDPPAYAKYFKAIEQSRELFRSAIPIGAGGVIGAAALASLATGLGATFAIPASELLHEHRCGALIEVADADVAKLPAALEPRVIGRISSEAFLTPEAVAAWKSAYPTLLGVA